jgi:hypothetical protein
MAKLVPYLKGSTAMNIFQDRGIVPTVATPRNPTLEDAQAYLEFLAQEHPELYEAIQSAERAYRSVSADVNQRIRESGESGED